MRELRVGMKRKTKLQHPTLKKLTSVGVVLHQRDVADEAGGADRALGNQVAVALEGQVWWLSKVRCKSYSLGGLAVNLAQVGKPFLVPVAHQAGADPPAGGHIQGCKKGRGAVAFLVVGHSAEGAGYQRKPRLRAIQCLNRALLVLAQADRMSGRVQIQPDDVNDFLCELRVVAHLGSAHQCGYFLPYPSAT